MLRTAEAEVCAHEGVLGCFVWECPGEVAGADLRGGWMVLDTLYRGTLVSCLDPKQEWAGWSQGTACSGSLGESSGSKTGTCQEFLGSSVLGVSWQVGAKVVWAWSVLGCFVPVSPWQDRAIVGIDQGYCGVYCTGVT